MAEQHHGMTDGSNRQPDAARSQWSAWVERHAPAVYGFLLALVRNPSLAEELTQEAFCRAWEAQHEGRFSDQGRERSYLLKIADRLAKQEARHTRRRTGGRRDDGAEPSPLADAVSDPSEGPLERLERHEAQEALADALDKLTPAQRRTLLLRYYGNLTFAEIARTLGCPLSTALSHGKRGLEALRHQLAEFAR